MQSQAIAVHLWPGPKLLHEGPDRQATWLCAGNAGSNGAAPDLLGGLGGLSLGGPSGGQQQPPQQAQQAQDDFFGFGGGASQPAAAPAQPQLPVLLPGDKGKGLTIAGRVARERGQIGELLTCVLWYCSVICHQGAVSMLGSENPSPIPPLLQASCVPTCTLAGCMGFPCKFAAGLSMTHMPSSPFSLLHSSATGSWLFSSLSINSSFTLCTVYSPAINQYPCSAYMPSTC